MKKFIAITALMAIAGGAQAATQTFIIGGGNWDTTAAWNDNATGNPGATTYDAGDVVPLLGGVLPWNPDTQGGGAPPVAAPLNGTATYSGSFDYDDVTGEVTSGSMTATGIMATNVQTTWWLNAWTDVVFDFAAGGSSTIGAYSCHDGIGNPADCYAAPLTPGSGYQKSGMELNGGGFEGDTAVARFAATFDGVDQLSLFVEGWAMQGDPGFDAEQNFTLTPIPIPAAVWLFGSALGLLGFARRRA